MTTVRDQRTRHRHWQRRPWRRSARGGCCRRSAIGFVLAGGWLGGLGGRLSEVQPNDSAAYLPDGAEATRALTESRRITGLEATSAVMVYTRPSGITEARPHRRSSWPCCAIRAGANHLASPARRSARSSPSDGQAAEVISASSAPTRTRSGPWWTGCARASPTCPGCELHVAGPAAILTDLLEVYGAIDLVLLAVTAAVILLILIVVYRSPILPFLVLAVAGAGAGHGQRRRLPARPRPSWSPSPGRRRASSPCWCSAPAPTTRCCGVPVPGGAAPAARTGTRRCGWPGGRRCGRRSWPAPARSWSRCSACSSPDLPSTRGLGPVAAIGIACALAVDAGAAAGDPRAARPGGVLALPAAAARRRVRRRRYRGAGPGSARAAWAGARGWCGWSPRWCWAGWPLGVTRLEADGVPRTESFLVTGGLHWSGRRC